VANAHANGKTALDLGRVHDAEQQLALLRRTQIALVARHADAAEKGDATPKERLHAEPLLRTIGISDVECALAEA
jgi:hypothetical protein